MTQRAAGALIYAAAVAIAVFLALQIGAASYYGGHYEPVGNDSFYHARRILDTAGERGFYEFDERIHVPEGSLIAWPWAYDYLLGQSVRVLRAIAPDTNPMDVLAFLPVAWLLVNVGLFVALTAAVGLPAGLRLIAALGYALFPMTQLLHGTGIIDHHFVEHTFVLGALLLTMRWAQQFERTGRAIALGALLGAAPAFHNGLFILQLPVLAVLGILWLRGTAPDTRAVRPFAIALPLVTLAVAAPSTALRSGMFEFGLLSWFHVYVAACTAVVSLVLSRLPRSPSGVAGLAAIAFGLALPLLPQALGGLAFLQGDIVLLDRIQEVRSPIVSLLDTDRRAAIIKLFSLLMVALPLFALWYGWRAIGERKPAALAFYVTAVFGAALMMLQIRLHYFGSFALILAPALIVHRYLPKGLARRNAIAMLIATIVLAVTYQKPLRQQLFARQNLSFDPAYELARPTFDILAAACRQDPGVVLATNNFGHPVSYHTDCSVIANNFLLTALHERKVAELEAAWSMSPRQLLDQGPPVRYVLVILENVYVVTRDGVRAPGLVELSTSNPPLAMGLVLEPSLPPRYTLLAERRLDDERGIPFIRLFRIEPESPPAQ
jgi:hypothetical protein